jgi:uncharacterized protein
MKTLVIGASENPERYSYKAIISLIKHEHEVVAIGAKQGSLQGITWTNELQNFDAIHTITLYLNPQRQKDYYNYILELKPNRVIMNPGTENEELANLLKLNNIEAVEACTLVMLSIGAY